MTEKLGQVIKAHSSTFIVKCGEQEIECGVRGKMKKSALSIAVGDFVNVDSENCIVKVNERSSYFVRPNVANVKVVCILVSPTPRPDFVMIDKLVVWATSQNVEVVFLFNKIDIESEVFDYMKELYSKVGCKMLCISANNNIGIEAVKECIAGKLTAFAGQSAVGKTSLINALFNLNLKTGEISEKLNRGKHTTTHSQIFEKDNLKVIDTPGFALLESNVKSEELQFFYKEFEPYLNNCKFRMCSHISEPSCAVKEGVLRGEIHKDRYERYKIIFEQLKEKEKYDKN